jgi:hypothetical protein
MFILNNVGCFICLQFKISGFKLNNQLLRGSSSQRLICKWIFNYINSSSLRLTPSNESSFLHLAILSVMLNDACNGFDVTVVILANACFSLLNQFTFLCKIRVNFRHSRHALLPGASTIYLGSMLSAANACMQRGLSSPSISIPLKREDRYFGLYFLHLNIFTHRFSN